MKKSYAILEIKKALKDAGLKIPVLDNTLLEQDEFTSLVAVQAFDDLETIFQIYLAPPVNRRIITEEVLEEAHERIRIKDKSIETLKNTSKSLAENLAKAAVALGKAEIEIQILKNKPQEIIHTHKFDKASRNAIVLAGYMSGRNGVGYSIINQGDCNNDILKDAIS